MRVAEKKLFSRDENDNSDLVQSSPKGKFVPFEKKNTYIGVKTSQDMQNIKDLFQNILRCWVTLQHAQINFSYKDRLGSDLNEYRYYADGIRSKNGQEIGLRGILKCGFTKCSID